MVNEDQCMSKSRILVVDDEETIRKSIQKRLEMRRLSGNRFRSGWRGMGIR